MLEAIRKAVVLPRVSPQAVIAVENVRQFRALEALLPGLLQRPRAGGRRVCVWSAGCATGEEPYSIAMTAAEAGADRDQIEVLATDVNPEAVAFAARGSYDARTVTAALEASRRGPRTQEVPS